MRSRSASIDSSSLLLGSAATNDLKRWDFFLYLSVPVNGRIGHVSCQERQT